MYNTRIFTEENIKKLDNLLHYLFTNKHEYTVSTGKTKQGAFALIVKW